MLESEGEEAVSPEVEDSYYIRRLDGGLFTLQTVDYILAWLVMEDDGVRQEIWILNAECSLISL